MINRSDIIIIGAGASGLIAAKELSAKGKKVTVLEAKSRAGGRIHTLPVGMFLQPVETGPEFIHGNLPVTLQLLKEAGIRYTKVEGDMLRNTGGRWHETEEPTEGWDELMEKMSKLKQDMVFTGFLNTYFPDKKYDKLRQSALQYAQGFDAVDPDKASVFSLRNEWQHEEEDTYRIDGGYVQLVNALITSCRQNNCIIAFDRIVTKVEWKQGEVNITTATNETFSAEQVVITVPAGVLQLEENEPGYIRFVPSLPQIQRAIQDIGYGNVIKILLQFSSLFWQEQKDALFFFSDQKIATWWTQQPSPYPLLTGWIAGKKAGEFDAVTEDEMLQMALQSIANIFNKPVEEIKQLLTASSVINWQKDVYAKGAYSYNMIASEEARKILNEPIENTLFFAGEALYSGASGGTVEAALVNGLDVVKKIMKE